MMLSVLVPLVGLLSAASSSALPASSTSQTSEHYAGVVVTHYPDGLPDELISRANQTALAKRSDIGVYLCNDIYFQGYCSHITTPPNHCFTLGDDLNNQVSSVGPDSGYCFFFENYGCFDSANSWFGIGNPGYNNLADSSQQSGQWNDRISAVLCHTS